MKNVIMNRNVNELMIQTESAQSLHCLLRETIHSRENEEGLVERDRLCKILSLMTKCRPIRNVVSSVKVSLVSSFSAFFIEVIFLKEWKKVTRP